MTDDERFLDALDTLRLLTEPDVFATLSPNAQKEALEILRLLFLDVNGELLRRTPGWPSEGGAK